MELILHWNCTITLIKKAVHKLIHGRLHCDDRRKTTKEAINDLIVHTRVCHWLTPLHVHYRQLQSLLIEYYDRGAVIHSRLVTLRTIGTTTSHFRRGCPNQDNVQGPDPGNNTDSGAWEGLLMTTLVWRSIHRTFRIDSLALYSPKIK